MQTLDPKMKVSEILKTYPETLSVFHFYNMKCAYDSNYADKTLEENFIIEQVNFMDLLSRLNKVINPAKDTPSLVDTKINATIKDMQITKDARERKQSSQTSTITTHQPEDATGWLIAVYVFAVLGGFLGVIIGTRVHQKKILLPDGQKVYKYKESHRTAAMIGTILSCLSIFFWKYIAS